MEGQLFEAMARGLVEPTGVSLDNLKEVTHIPQSELARHWGYVYLIRDSITGELYIGQHERRPNEKYFRYLGSGSLMEEVRKERAHTLEKHVLNFAHSRLHALHLESKAINKAVELNLPLTNQSIPKTPQRRVGDVLRLNCLLCGVLSPVSDYCSHCLQHRGDEVKKKRKSLFEEKFFHPEVTEAKERSLERALLGPAHAARLAFDHYGPLKKLSRRNNGSAFFEKLSITGGGWEVWTDYLTEARRLLPLSEKRGKQFSGV